MTPRIQETKGRPDENSGYGRLLGNTRLGQLISRVHATVIRTGYELERRLEAATSSSLKSEFSAALSLATNARATGLKVVFSPKIKKTPDAYGITGDIVVFDYSGKRLSVVEVKDGDTFDTKKASGELESLKTFARQLSHQTGYEASIHFCSFNQDDKASIIAGAKGRFSPEQVMTGGELCGILNIDFEEFKVARSQEQASNLEYFLAELTSIPEIADQLRRRLR